MIAADQWLESTGFNERGEWRSTALHRSREQLASSPSRLSRIIERHAPELRFTPSVTGWGIHRALPDNQPGCQLSVFLNGSRVVRRRSAAGTIDDLAKPDELDGLEIHVGDDGPVVDACGAVLLWTFSRAEAPDLSFHGRIVGQVTGAQADTVIAVRIEPSGDHLSLAGGGRFASGSLLPGLYEVIHVSAGGPISRREVRVFAHHDVRVDLDIVRHRWRSGSLGLLHEVPERLVWSAPQGELHRRMRPWDGSSSTGPAEVLVGRSLPHRQPRGG